MTTDPHSASAALTVVVLTYNEEANLPACIASLRGLKCELHVVDSGSTDRTLDIAARCQFDIGLGVDPNETLKDLQVCIDEHITGFALEITLGSYLDPFDADPRFQPGRLTEIPAAFR